MSEDATAVMEAPIDMGGEDFGAVTSAFEQMSAESQQKGEKTADTVASQPEEKTETTEQPQEGEETGEGTEEDSVSISRADYLRLQEMEAQQQLNGQFQAEEGAKGAKEGKDAAPEKSAPQMPELPTEFASMIPPVPQFTHTMTPELADALGIDIGPANQLVQVLGNTIYAQMAEYMQKAMPAVAMGVQAQYHPFLAAEAQVFQSNPVLVNHPAMVRLAMLEARKADPEGSPWSLSAKATDILKARIQKANQIAKSGGTKVNQTPQRQFRTPGTSGRTPDGGGRAKPSEAPTFGIPDNFEL